MADLETVYLTAASKDGAPSERSGYALAAWCNAHGLGSPNNADSANSLVASYVHTTSGSASWTTPGTHYFTMPPYTTATVTIYGSGGAGGPAYYVDFNHNGQNSSFHAWTAGGGQAGQRGGLGGTPGAGGSGSYAAGQAGNAGTSGFAESWRGFGGTGTNGYGNGGQSGMITQTDGSGTLYGPTGGGGGSGGCTVVAFDPASIGIGVSVTIVVGQGGGVTHEGTGYREATAGANGRVELTWS